MDFVVNKRTWAREGANKGTSALRNENGNKCCLGFVCNQLGINPKQLTKLGTPEEFFELSEDFKTNDSLFKKLKPLVTRTKKNVEKDIDGTLIDYSSYENSKLSSAAININDDEKTTDVQKIEALTKLFKKHGHTITFK